MPALLGKPSYYAHNYARPRGTCMCSERLAMCQALDKVSNASADDDVVSSVQLWIKEWCSGSCEKNGPLGFRGVLLNPAPKS